MKVKIINESGFDLPKYETNGSAGMDLRSVDKVTINPGERKLVNTGIKIALPEGYEAQIRPRSGLALKKGISVLNTPGTVDVDYRNYIGVILINHGSEPFDVNPGDRIAQMVVTKYERVEWELTDELDKTERGEGGFGHSGVK